MSRRANLINLFVAAATGVASGVYIFQPMIANNAKPKTPDEDSVKAMRTKPNSPTSKEMHTPENSGSGHASSPEADSKKP